jgi:hypothetical protein
MGPVGWIILGVAAVAVVGYIAYEHYKDRSDPVTDTTTCEPPYERRGKSRICCKVRCHIKNFSNVPNAPGMVTVIGCGPDEATAIFNGMKAAQKMSPSGTHTRHCHPVGECWRN